MNAYELADDAKNISNTIEALEFVQKAVPMLRQQADRIAVLEGSMPANFVSKLMADDVDKDALVSVLKDRIAELEKDKKELQFHIKWLEVDEQKIKPIGYVDCCDYQNLYDGEISDCILKNKPSIDDTDVALFATPAYPVKQLSDEEIEELKDALEVCDYKYFGSYEFSERQWEAFEVIEKHAKSLIKEITE